jgi:hypothetical protein
MAHGIDQWFRLAGRVFGEGIERSSDGFPRFEGARYRATQQRKIREIRLGRTLRWHSGLLSQRTARGSTVIISYKIPQMIRLSRGFFGHFRGYWGVSGTARLALGVRRFIAALLTP